jgi:hypothetical protein
MPRRARASAHAAIGTFTNITQRQLAYSVSRPPTRTPKAPGGVHRAPHAEGPHTGPARGERRGQQCQCGRSQRGGPDALRGSGGDQMAGFLGEAPDERSETEQAEPEQQEPPPAVPVGGLATQQEQPAEGEGVGVDNPMSRGIPAAASRRKAAGRHDGGHVPEAPIAALSHTARPHRPATGDLSRTDPVGGPPAHRRGGLGEADHPSAGRRAGHRATTLYHHVQGKDDLLILLLNHCIGETERPRLPSDPRDRIVVAASAAHDALTAWPWAAEVITADGFIGLLDEAALWMVETILAGAHDYGCTPEQTVYVLRSIWYYTAGEVLVRARSPHRRTDGELPTYRVSFDASQVPHLAAVGDRWAALAARDTYLQGLRAFVDGLLAQATSADPPGVD